MIKKYFTVPQAAKICSVNSSTMYRWVTSGKIISHSTPGGHRRISPEDLKKWLEDNQMPFDINEFQNDEIKILVVDDEIGIQNYLKKLLSGIFITVEVASDGFDAGKKVVHFKPDLMILDLFMPNMDGFEVCKNIKNDPATKKIKILIMTGHGTKENQDKAMSLGADAFLRKPSSKNEILECVKKLVKQK